MSDLIHLDFETRSACDLKKVGAFRYANDPSTEILVCGLGLNDEEPVAWRSDGCYPSPAYYNKVNDILRLLATDPTCLVYAHNAQFEIAITDALWRKTFGMSGPTHDQWRCTAAMARRAALPAKLEKLAEYICPEMPKDPGGKALIRKFSVPQKATKKRPQGGFIDPKEESAAFQAFVDYCLQDVRAERAVHQKLKAFELTEKDNSLATFQLDIAINTRGLPVNLQALHAANKLLAEVTEKLAKEFTALTGLQHTQGKQLLAWCKAQGVDLPNLQAATLEEQLEEMDIDDTSLVGRALKLKQQMAYASVKKIPAMIACAGPHDNRVRGTIVYHGPTTGRWAGALIQPQNFKRPTVPCTEQAYKAIAAGVSADTIDMVYGPPIEVLSSCVRHFIHDKDECHYCNGTGGIDSGGFTPWGEGITLPCPMCEGCPQKESPFLNADYAAIEARIVCWLADEQEALAEYRQGLDRYKVMASAIYRVPVDKVTKDQRFVGKQAVLGCGFQLGAAGFIKGCAKYKVDIDMELAEATVNAFRARHKKLVSFWYALDRTCKASINSPGRVTKVGKLEVFCTKTAGKMFLFIRLPSRRLLCYPEPAVSDDRLTFYGQRPMTVHWGRVDTYGGKLVENVTQAVAADIMANGAIAAEAAGYEIATLIHDEALAYYNATAGQSIEEFCRLLTALPKWADGLPIEAEGEIIPFYKK